MKASHSEFSALKEFSLTGVACTSWLLSRGHHDGLEQSLGVAPRVDPGGVTTSPGILTLPRTDGLRMEEESEGVYGYTSPGMMEELSYFLLWRIFCSDGRQGPPTAPVFSIACLFYLVSALICAHLYVSYHIHACMHACMHTYIHTYIQT